jgi:hypothetical protein
VIGMTASGSNHPAHLYRMYAEYLEMPGLRLTCAQAQRLWGLDAATCTSALEYLVEARFLRRTESGEYVRLTDGSVAVLPFRMVKADLDRSPGRRLAV